ADVEDATVAPVEQIHAGRVRKLVGEPDLREMRASARGAGAAEIAEREDPEAPSELQQAVEDVRARLRVGERAVRGTDRGAEVLRERLEANVRHVRPHDPPRELRGADRRSLQQRIVELAECRVQEPEVEAR